jgi:3-oxoacyl-[acyl-carrier protein] reductase
MTSPLSGKVALVTGASRGIGRAIAERLAKDGAAVMVHYMASQAAAREVAAGIVAVGGKAEVVQGDIADLDAVARILEQTTSRFGRLDILVNNAAEGPRAHFDAVTPAHFDRLFAITRGTFFAMQGAARVMGEGGRIISITSAAVKSCMADAPVYASSKAAIETFSKCLSRDLGVRGITVNCVAPGVTDTDMVRGGPVHLLDSARKGNAFKRLAAPTDIADVVAIVASSDARWLTGQVIGADGGL